MMPGQICPEHVHVGRRRRARQGGDLPRADRRGQVARRRGGDRAASRAISTRSCPARGTGSRPAGGCDRHRVLDAQHRRARRLHRSRHPARSPSSRTEAQSRGSTWTLGPGPASGPRFPASRSGTSSSPITSLTSASGTTAPRRELLDGTGQPRRRRQDPDRRHVLERDVAGVDEARCSGEADEHDPAGGLHQPRRDRRAAGDAGGVDDGVETASGSSNDSTVPVCCTPSSRASCSDDSRAPARCTSMPRASANWAASSPMVPDPSTRRRWPGSRAAARTARRLFPPAPRERRP